MQDPYDEMTTEEVDHFLEDKLVVRIPITRGTDITFAAALGVVGELEDRADVIVFSENAMFHYKVHAPKAKSTEKVLNSLHLDYLPFTTVIVSLPNTKENEHLLSEKEAKFGII